MIDVGYLLYLCTRESPIECTYIVLPNLVLHDSIAYTFTANSFLVAPGRERLLESISILAGKDDPIL